MKEQKYTEEQRKELRELFPDITLYEQGGVVRNTYTQEVYELSGEELAVYDLLMGAQATGHHKMVSKCLSWFIDNNAEAYMALLD